MKNDIEILNLSEWLNEYLISLLRAIEKSKKPDNYIAKLDKIISIKKKYEQSIDRYSEIVRVMNEFVDFIQARYPRKSKVWREIIFEFMSNAHQKSSVKEDHEKINKNRI